MNEIALGWLRAMVSPTTAPAPASLRHTVPPPSASLTSGDRVTRTESLADLERYSWGCVGLCPGGTCERCDGLADEIGWARVLPADYRRAREADLTQQINALREGR